MAANSSPENSDKFVFAEDFVNYVMARHSSVRPERGIAELFREGSVNGFNDYTRAAIRYLENTKEMCHNKILFYVIESDAVNSRNYLRYVDKFKREKFPNGFDVNNFFPLCVYLALLASAFYNNGVENAPHIAIDYIENLLEDFDTANGGWETLNSIARRYAYMDAVKEQSP